MKGDKVDELQKHNAKFFALIGVNEHAPWETFEIYSQLSLDGHLHKTDTYVRQHLL